MNATPSRSLPQHLTVVLTLAHALQQLEGSRRVDADTYRNVAQTLSEQLANVPVDAALHAVLDAYPAAALVYENLNYAHAGLCRSALDTSMRAELSAKDVIRRVAKA